MNVEELVEQEEQFFALRDELMTQAEASSVTMRVSGAVAFRTHCPQFKYMAYELGRVLADLDFAAYSRDMAEIEKLFLDLGYEQSQMVKMLYATQRRIFYHPQHGVHCDVFFDKLRFCHDVDLRGRLEIDYPTISLVDLLLEKMQIVEINRKDITDTIMLLREHAVGNHDQYTMNADYLAQLCGSSWGLWRTISTNLQKVLGLMPGYAVLTGADRSDVMEKIRALQARLDGQPKTLAWRLRARIGDRVQWYRDVEEVAR
jgi:hypothetical protein